MFNLFFSLMLALAALAPAHDPIKCAATTKAGTPCTRKAQEGSTLCWQHSQVAMVRDSAAVQAAPGQQCSGTTKAGARCRNITKAGDRCHLHRAK